MYIEYSRRLTMLEGGKDQQVPAGEEEHMDQDMDYSMDEVNVRVYVNEQG